MKSAASKAGMMKLNELLMEEEARYVASSRLGGLPINVKRSMWRTVFATLVDRVEESLARGDLKEEALAKALAKTISGSDNDEYEYVLIMELERAEKRSAWLDENEAQ